MTAEEFKTVSIPVALHDKIERIASRDGQFRSVSYYVSRVLREFLATHEKGEAVEPLPSSDIEEIKHRLRSLGYLG